MSKLNRLSDDLSSRIIKELESDPQEIYWDYRDSLSEEQVQKIFDDPDNLWEIEDDIYMNNLDYIFDLESELIKEVIATFIDEIAEELEYVDDYGDEREEYFKSFAYDDLFDDMKDYVCVNTNIDDLIRNTDVYVNVTTEFEWNASGWGLNFYNNEYEELEEVLTLFNINPRRFAESLINEERVDGYPNKPERDGNENMEFDDFIEMVENHTTEYSRIVFTIDLDLADYVKNYHKYNGDIIIKAGTYTWTHDAWNGSCGMNERTTKDIRIPSEQYDLKIDGSYGYGLDDICGLVKSGIWDTEPEFEELEIANL